jgi:hypothetical protein
MCSSQRTEEYLLEKCSIVWNQTQCHAEDDKDFAIPESFVVISFPELIDAYTRGYECHCSFFIGKQLSIGILLNIMTSNGSGFHHFDPKKEARTISKQEKSWKFFL